MKNQEGYIKLDGEVVSKAAKKAFDHYFEQDTINEQKFNELKEEMLAKEKVEQDYWDNHAEKDFRYALKTFRKTEQVTKRRLLFVSTETVDVADIEKAKEYLVNKDSSWEFKFATTLVDFRVYGKWCDPDRFKFINSWNFKHFDSYQAPYYKQFFDLTGDVYLTLDQYGKIKEFMNEE